MHIDDLNSIKEALSNEKNRAMTKKELLQKRDEWHSQKEILKKNISKNALAMHRYSTFHSEKAQNLADALENEKYLLQKIENEIKDIDYQIEEYEEEIDEKIEKMKEMLLDAHPNLKIKNEEKTKYQMLRKAIEPFYLHLKQGAALHKSMKVRSFFLFPFTRHPKVLIAEKIAHAGEEAKRLLKEKASKELVLRKTGSDTLILDNIWTLLPLESQEFALFFEKFLIEVNKAWNRSLYEEKILDLFSTFSEKVEKLEKRIFEIDNEVANLEHTNELQRTF